MSRSSTPICCHNDATTTKIYTLSLHDALPIYGSPETCGSGRCLDESEEYEDRVIMADQINSLEELGSIATATVAPDRKSTRLNSSHVKISYAVFCLKKKIDQVTILVQTRNYKR